MKKSLLSLVLLLGVSLFLFSSCDGDSDSSITGTWQANEMMVMSAAGGIGEAALPDSWSEQLTFNSDHTYRYAWSKDGGSGSGSGTWARANGNLQLTEGGQTQEIPYSLNSAYLSIKSVVAEGEAELIFSRVE